MPRTTKASLHRARMEAEQAEREAQCQANGHNWRNEYNHLRYCEMCFELEEYQWIQPGMTVTHKNDPLWTGKVLSVTSQGVRVHRGDEYNYIECTFQPGELIIEEKTS